MNKNNIKYNVTNNNNNSIKNQNLTSLPTINSSNNKRNLNRNYSVSKIFIFKKNFNGNTDDILHMFFTKEDFKKIEEYLKLNAKKDTDFDILNQNVKGDDSIAFVHEGRNYRMSLQEFAASLGEKGQYLLDGAFINMSWEDTDDDGIFSFTPYNSLQKAAQNTPLKYRIPGGVLAWVNSQGMWQLHQFIGQISDDWNNMSLWKNFNDVTPSGVEFTSSLSKLYEGQSVTTILECHTKDGSPAISMKLYKNDELIQEVNNTDSFTIEQAVDSTTDFKVIAQHYSYTYEEKIHIPMVQTAWIGAANIYQDVITDENKIQFEETIIGDYTVEFTEKARLFIVVPSNIVLNPIALNGLEVPILITQEVLVNGKNCNIYSSANQYLADEYTFIINTYEGMYPDIVLGLQQRVGDMQDALNEMGVQLTLTDSDFTAGPGEKIVQQNKTLTISDGKDHSVSFNVVTLSKQQIQYYTITFNTMGGTPIAAIQQVEAGTMFNLNSVSTTKSGKLFGGWYDNQEYTGNVYSGTITVNNNLTLYAKWNEGHQYLLSTSIPQSIPTFSSTSASTVTLGNLVGWSNWYGQDNQYIILPAVSGKSQTSDYIDITDQYNQSILGDFEIVSSSLPSIVVIKQNGFSPLDDSDASAILIFK